MNRPENRTRLRLRLEAVIKYADNILKNFATSVSIVRRPDVDDRSELKRWRERGGVGRSRGGAVHAAVQSGVRAS